MLDDADLCEKLGRELLARACGCAGRAYLPAKARKARQASGVCVIWFLSDLDRFARERRAIEELQARSGGWLTNVTWQLAPPTLAVDADIVIDDRSFPVTLTYPYAFPHCPPSVKPRGVVMLHFCHGPQLVNPLSHDPVAGVLLLSGSALGRHLMGSDKEQVGQSNSARSSSV
jgi:hypothetical protein